MRYGIIDGIKYLNIQSITKNNYLELVDSLSNYKEEFNKIFSELDKDNFGNLYSFYKQELSELEKINKKMCKYNIALNNIKLSYEIESQRIYQDSIYTLKSKGGDEKNG